MADEIQADDALRELAAQVYRAAMKSMVAAPQESPRLIILRHSDIFGKETARTPYSHAVQDEAVTLSAQEKTLCDHLENKGLLAPLKGFELAGKMLVRGLHRKGYAVPGGRGKGIVLVMYDDSRAANTDLMRDITGLELPPHGPLETIRASQTANTHFVHKACCAFYESSSERDLQTWKEGEASYLFQRAAAHHVFSLTGDDKAAYALHNAALLKGFGPEYEPMAGVAGLIPKDILQAAQTETLSQLIDVARGAPALGTMFKSITDRLGQRGAQLRAGGYDPHQVAWNLRMEAARAGRVGLELNNPVAMLPLVGELLEWQFTEGKLEMPLEQAQHIADIFSPPGKLELGAMHRETLFLYLPTMLLAGYGEAAQEILGTPATRLLPIKSRRWIRQLLGPGRSKGPA